MNTSASLSAGSASQQALNSPDNYRDAAVGYKTIILKKDCFVAANRKAAAS